MVCFGLRAFLSLEEDSHMSDQAGRNVPGDGLALEQRLEALVERKVAERFEAAPPGLHGAKPSRNRGQGVTTQPSQWGGAVRV